MWTFIGDMPSIISTTAIAGTARLLNSNGSALMVRMLSDFFFGTDFLAQWAYESKLAAGEYKGTRPMMAMEFERLWGLILLGHLFGQSGEGLWNRYSDCTIAITALDKYMSRSSLRN